MLRVILTSELQTSRPLKIDMKGVECRGFTSARFLMIMSLMQNDEQLLRQILNRMVSNYLAVYKRGSL